MVHWTLIPHRRNNPHHANPHTQPAQNTPPHPSRIRPILGRITPILHLQRHHRRIHTPPRRQLTPLTRTRPLSLQPRRTKRSPRNHTHRTRRPQTKETLARTPGDGARARNPPGRQLPYTFNPTRKEANANHENPNLKGGDPLHFPPRESDSRSLAWITSPTAQRTDAPHLPPGAYPTRRHKTRPPGKRPGHRTKQHTKKEKHTK
jgi:hypothetical protein